MKRKRSKASISSSEDLILSKSRNYIDKLPENCDEPDAENKNSNKQLRKATDTDKERKREKARLKCQKKRELKLLGNGNENKIAALSYLHLWDSDREKWTFKKNRQCWLLRNVFSPEKISDEDFSVLLKYIVCLQGVALHRLVTDAENMIKNNGISENKGEENDETCQNLTYNRARDILQILVRV